MPLGVIIAGGLGIGLLVGTIVITASSRMR